MTKEKKTFAWDTVLNMSVASGKMTVVGTDIEVVWCPVTKMFWEIQTNPVINVGTEKNPMMVLCATTMSMMYEEATGKTFGDDTMDDYVQYCDDYCDGYNKGIE